jgi:hypothetical protein
LVGTDLRVPADRGATFFPDLLAPVAFEELDVFDATLRFTDFEPVFFVFNAIPLPWDVAPDADELNRGVITTLRLFPIRS